MTKNRNAFGCVLSAAFDDDDEPSTNTTAKPKTKAEEKADDKRDSEALQKLVADAAENGKESKALKDQKQLSVESEAQNG